MVHETDINEYILQYYVVHRPLNIQVMKKTTN